MKRQHQLLLMMSASLIGIAPWGCADDTTATIDAAVVADLRPDTRSPLDGAADLRPDAGPIPDAGQPPWDELNKLPGASFMAIWGSEPKDLYVVGMSGLIFHRDGFQWTPLESGTAADLHGVFGISSSEVYAVGDRSLLSFDGQTWSESSEYSASYRAVWGAAGGKIWAVGLGGVMRHRPAGTGAWTAIPGSGTDKDLYGIWGLGELAYAVGAEGTIIKLSGNKWEAQTSGVAATLRGIWGSAADNIYAAGDGGTLIHFDGSSWTPVQTPSAADFTGVWGHGDQLFVVGKWTAEHGQALHFDGAAWQSSSPAGVATLHGVWGFTPAEVFVINAEKVFQYQPQP